MHKIFISDSICAYMVDNKIFLQIVEAALEGDKTKLINLLNSLAIQEASKKRYSLYNKILNLINLYSHNTSLSQSSAVHYQNQNILDQDYLPKDVWVSDINKLKIQQFIKLSQLSSTHFGSMRHINKLLLYGPPGTGKTTLGFYIARMLKKKILYVKVSDVISSKFGETMKNFSDIFKNSQEEVIFIDEFDAFAKNRKDNSNDVGELKRIVNSMIQTLDFQSKNKIVIVATNLVDTIDPAILRRFAFKIYIGKLEKNELKEFINFIITKEDNFDVKMQKEEKDLLLDIFEYINIDTIDQINLFFEKTFMTAFFEKRKVIELNNFIEVLFFEDYFNKDKVKIIKKSNPQILNKMGALLRDKGLTKQEIASLMGIHRNSYSTYVEEI